MRALVVALVIGCGTPAKPPPKPKSPPLETASLAAITQGPGARFALMASPRALFSGPLAPYANKLVPAAGLDKLQAKLGFDLRKVASAQIVGFTATTFYAARLPDGVAPSAALDAFEKRLLAPIEHQNPRPDLVRVIGGLPAGVRGSAVGMWSTHGDTIVGESGRLGPAIASMALAAGKLARERSLASDKTFAPLLTWSSNAELALLARCPLGDAVSDEKENVLFQECFGVGVAFRSAAAGKLAIVARITGAWGKDQTLAEDEVRATIARVSEADVGRVLGIRDAKVDVHAQADAIDATITVDASVFTEGLGRVLEQQIGDATK